MSWDAMVSYAAPFVLTERGWERQWECYADNAEFFFAKTSLDDFTCRRRKVSGQAIDKLHEMLTGGPRRPSPQSELIIEDNQRAEESRQADVSRQLAEIHALPEWRRPSAFAALKHSAGDNKVLEWRDAASDGWQSRLQDTDSHSQRRRKIKGAGLQRLQYLVRKEIDARNGLVVREETERVVQDSTSQTENFTSSSTCSICLSAPSTQAFAPCGHRCLCDACSQNPHPKCPICRETAQGLYRVHVGVELLLTPTPSDKRSSQDVPEWRQLAAARTLGISGGQKRLQSDSVAALQQLLLANTTRRMVQTRCNPADASCQTDVGQWAISMCALCQHSEPTHAALPCGHCCLCETCCKAATRCPLCESSMETLAIRIYD